MDQELFNPQSSSVSSSRIIYTPSTFARTSLLHLQEAGSLQAIHPHTSTRTNLLSFLCFIVLSGKGELSYEEQTYQLSEGDCVFIDCRKAYSHSTSNDLWSLQWCHFYAPSLPAVYEKYKERGGRPVFHPADIKPFTTLLTDIYDLASSSDYIRDMRINEKLGTLLTLLMEQSWHPETVTVSRKRMELAAVKEYLDEHYTEKLTLDDLAEKFFINKFYLSKIFKEAYGTTVNNYLISKLKHNDLRTSGAGFLCRWTSQSTSVWFRSTKASAGKLERYADYTSKRESTRRQSWCPACMVRFSMWLLIFDRVIPLGMLMARSSPLKIRSRC